MSPVHTHGPDMQLHLRSLLLQGMDSLGMSPCTQRLTYNVPCTLLVFIFCVCFVVFVGCRHGLV